MKISDKLLLSSLVAGNTGFMCLSFGANDEWFNCVLAGLICVVAIGFAGYYGAAIDRMERTAKGRS